MLLFQLGLILIPSWCYAMVGALPGPMQGHREVWVLLWHCQPLPNIAWSLCPA